MSPVEGVGARVARSVQEAADEGLLAAAELVRHRTIENLPIGDPADDPDPAVALKDHVEIHPAGRIVTIVAATEYAAKQHEDLHLKHPRGGGPKFLERALLQTIPELEGIVAGKVRANIRAR